MDKIRKLADIIERAERIVFFGGAGVSTESGIPDFRSVDGIYNMKYDYPPEMILSSDFFFENTEEFYRFYKDKMLAPGVKPNAAHISLARLEELGKLTGVVTQNIDGLHQDAGSRKVFELHGSVRRNYCLACGKFHDDDYIRSAEGIPRCDCGAVIKPDVVLYGEMLDDETVRGAVDAIRRADTMIVAGTSMTVYPAAGLVSYFGGRDLVLINRDETPLDSDCTLVIHDKVGKTLEEALKLL